MTTEPSYVLRTSDKRTRCSESCRGSDWSSSTVASVWTLFLLENNAVKCDFKWYKEKNVQKSEPVTFGTWSTHVQYSLLLNNRATSKQRTNKLCCCLLLDRPAYVPIRYTPATRDSPVCLSARVCGCKASSARTCTMDAEAQDSRTQPQSVCVHYI